MNSVEACAHSWKSPWGLNTSLPPRLSDLWLYSSHYLLPSNNHPSTGFPYLHSTTTPTPTPTHSTKSRNRKTTYKSKMAFTASDIIKLIFAIFLPPLGVFLERGCNADFLINILLTILGYIPVRWPPAYPISLLPPRDANKSAYRESSTPSTSSSSFKAGLLQRRRDDDRPHC